jgi:hypothetical protein
VQRQIYDLKKNNQELEKFKFVLGTSESSAYACSSLSARPLALSVVRRACTSAASLPLSAVALRFVAAVAPDPPRLAFSPKMFAVRFLIPALALFFRRPQTSRSRSSRTRSTRARRRLRTRRRSKSRFGCRHCWVGCCCSFFLPLAVWLRDLLPNWKPHACVLACRRAVCDGRHFHC